MIQWEYRLERLGELLTDWDVKKKGHLRKMGSIAGLPPDEPDDLSAVDQLNLLGNHGWELVAIVPDDGNGVAVLKRPLV
jgi:hypothetical protein